MLERIHKVLARAGYGSRRQVETWVILGRVSCNGKISILGDKIRVSDVIKLDGKALSSGELWKYPQQILLYNKPVGELCTRKDPDGRRIIYQSLPAPDHGRWVSVGRLDINTSGLIIHTTDGKLANTLMHPSNVVDREYAVRILGEVTTETLYNLVNGVSLDDGQASFLDVRRSGGKGANSWFHVVIQEGRNRVIRRLWESQGVQVSRLMRVRYGPVINPSKLRIGNWMIVGDDEAKSLYNYVNLSSGIS